MYLDHQTESQHLWTVFDMWYMCTCWTLPLVCPGETVRLFHACLWWFYEDPFRCTATFECSNENQQIARKTNEIDVCTTIERVTPNTISIDALPTEVRRIWSRRKISRSSLDCLQFEVMFNLPLKSSHDEYKCQFLVHDRNDLLFHTNVILLQNNTLRCSSPLFRPMTQGKRCLFDGTESERMSP